jgi:hypothetical protein
MVSSSSGRLIATALVALLPAARLFAADVPTAEPTPVKWVSLDTLINMPVVTASGGVEEGARRC